MVLLKFNPALASKEICARVCVCSIMHVCVRKKEETGRIFQRDDKSEVKGQLSTISVFRAEQHLFIHLPRLYAPIQTGKSKCPCKSHLFKLAHLNFPGSLGLSVKFCNVDPVGNALKG